MARTDRGEAPWATLVPLLLGTFTGTIANSIVNVPLTLIARDLGVSISAGTLIVIGFALTFAVLLPVSGWLADRCGSRRVFVIAMVVLGLGSAGAGLAGDLTLLVAMRAVQGIATAAMLSAVMTLLAELFDGGRRGMAIGLWAAANGVGQAAGPTLGGGLATWFGWHSVFWPTVPLSFAAAALAVRVVPAGRPRPMPLDRSGAALLTLGAGLMLGAVSAAAPLGATSPVVWCGALAGLLTAGAYVGYCRGRPDAFLPPRLLLEVRYLRSCLSVMAQMFCLGATLLAVPAYLTTQRHGTPLYAGGVLLSLPVVMSALGPVTGVLMQRLSPRAVLRGGLSFLIAGQVLVAVVLARSGATPWLLAALALTGVGVAFVQTPAMTGATRSEAGRRGAGLGLFNLLRFGAAALGAAWVGVVLDHGPAYGVVFAACAGAAVLGLLSSFAGSDPE